MHSSPIRQCFRPTAELLSTMASGSKSLSLLGIPLTSGSISVSRSYDADETITLGFRIVYTDERAIEYSLVPKAKWKVLTQEQAKRVRQDLTSIGMGGSIPKKENMWSSAVLPGSVELAALDRSFGHVRQYRRVRGIPMHDSLLRCL